MHITDHLQPCCVALRQQADSLPAAIHQLVELVQKSGCLTNTVQFEQDVLEREKMGGICMMSFSYVSKAIRLILSLT